MYTSIVYRDVHHGIAYNVGKLETTKYSARELVRSTMVYQTVIQSNSGDQHLMTWENICDIF